ncbi:MAG: SRPBCC domain-containing protein [Methylocella sp.]
MQNGHSDPAKDTPIVSGIILIFTNIATDNEGNRVLDGLTTVIFAEHGGKSKLILETRAFAVAAHAAPYLAGMEAGWTQCLERLKEHLATAG